MRATTTLGLASALLLPACSPPPPAPPPLPLRVELGGATLVVEREDVTIRVDDDPSARLTVGGASIRAVRVERDAGAMKVLLESGPPVTLALSERGVVASPRGAISA